MSRLFSPFHLVLGLVLTALGLFAQSSQSVIVGNVLDPSGAGVPGASVAAREVSTNAKFESKTGGTGYYVLPSLPVGRYEVTAAARGFMTGVRPDVILRVGDRSRVDFTLQVGVVEPTR